MSEISRRGFLKTTAAAAGIAAAGSVIPGAWLRIANADAPDYFLKEFGITDGISGRVLANALGKGGDFADLFFEHTISNWVILEDGIVNRAYGNIKLGVGIRTVKGDQVGYGFTQELTEESMLAAAATAATIADSNSVAPAREFVMLKTKNYYPLAPLLTDVPLSSKLPVVQGLNDKCFALSDLVVKVKAGFHDSQKRIMVVTSDGVKTQDLRPRTYLYASVVAEKNGKREKGWWNLGGRRDFSFYTKETIDSIAKSAVDRAIVLFDAKPAPAGEMPVVLGPGVTGILLHEAIGHGMEADFNRKRISTFSTMLNRKVAEPFVNIYDDGTMPSLLGALNVDDEGTPTKKTPLVEKGILTSYLHDKISAKHYGIKPTGNGRRESYEHYVMPRMRNTYMTAGPAELGDLIKEAKNGILVKDVSNGQVKIGEGDYAFYVSEGRLIENGKLTAPIKDMNIIGNGPKTLANIIGVANDFEMCLSGTGHCGKNGQRVPVGFGLPSCLIKSVTVGGVS